MKYPAYQKYKPGGEWLGELPQQWGQKRLKNAAAIKTGFAFSSDDFTDEGIPVLRIGDITKDGRVDFSDAKFLPWEFQRSHRNVVIQRNDIVMAMTGATIGKVGRYPYNMPALLNQRVCSFRARSDLEQDYLWYVLNTQFYVDHVLLTAFGGAQPNISDSELLACRVPIPPKEEQGIIADFLDAETAKLDTLMVKKRELVEKLKEKRTAIISRTVTRGLPPEASRGAGLNPQPKLRSSGIEWLGEIPDGWRVTKVWLERISRNLELQDGNHGELHPKAEDYVDTGIPFVMANHIVRGRIDFDICNYIERELADSLRIGFSRTGDVLLTHKGTIGRVGLVQENPFPYVMLTPQVTYYRCLHDIDNRFLFWALQGSYWQDQMGLVSSLGTTREYVGLLDQKRLYLLFPPAIEQDAIADYLDRETGKIDRMVEKVEDAIERLQEYRTALITAAVTGKIDVREPVHEHAV